MEKEKQRKHERIDSLNLLNYIVLNKDGEITRQGMGRTLNVSQGGILLETHLSIPDDHLISLSIGLEDEMIDIKGKIVYSREGGNQKYESGIEFFEINENAMRVLNKYIAAFRELKGEHE
jgi:c-di-GMP-binding flagellar brake protein YcgR